MEYVDRREAVDALGAQVTALAVGPSIPRRAQERRKHFLQTADENVGLACPLGQLLDLRILDLHLPAQKAIVTFEARDVAVLVATNGRVCSRLFGVVREGGGQSFDLTAQSANGRDRSRLVATRRDSSHLVDIGDMARHRVGRDEIFFASFGFYFVAIELGNCTVFLHGSDSSRMAGLGIQLGRLFDREGILLVRRTVATGRARSWLFVGHKLMIPRWG